MRRLQDCIRVIEGFSPSLNRKCVRSIWRRDDVILEANAVLPVIHNGPFLI
jgi:hypothetical protein